MKKTIYLKSVLLLCLLLVGAVSTHAEDYDYEWVKVTDLNEVNTGDIVVLADGNLALKNDQLNGVFAVSVIISDGKILDENVGDNIKWTLTKNETDGTFKFANETGAYLSVENGNDILIGSTEADPITEFSFKDYSDNGGKLYFGDDSYIKLENNKAVVGSPGSTFILYKRTKKNYVKWKRIGSENVNLEEDAVIVVVDLKSGRALSNDKADKDPDAVAVTLNDDKDRILGEVPEKVQWIYNRTQGKGATFKTNDDKYLYADTENKGLKVGEPTGDNQYFSYGCENDIFFSLWTNIGSDAYLLGVEESMFSNTWKLIKPESGEDIDLAFFKKIEDPQKIVTIELAEYYTIYSDVINYTDLNASITGAEFSKINWASSKPGVATAATVTDEETNRTYGKVTGYQRGSTVITASVIETDYHDKASAKSTVIVDETQSTVPGSLQNPLTVAQAKQLIESENKTITIDGQTVTWAEGVRYYIKGKVSKVNSGMMAMFGDMDFGEMMGGSGSEDSMDDMDFDPEDMEESGFDMSSFDMSSFGFDMSAMFGTSDKVTYYISDDGTKDGQMKVVNGCGTLNSGGSTAMEFNPIPKLSAGDCVVVCGPLVYTEDTNMFSSMMGGNKDEQPKMSGKVDEMNYLAVYDPTLLITEPEPKEIFVNKTLDGSKEAETPIYTIDELFNRFNEDKFPEGAEIQPATYKSSDEDIAKWDEETNIITGVNEGKAKITVKVKVVLPKREGDDDSKERSYTMKRKFKLIVKTRDLDPAGYYDGEWKLTTSTDDLEDGTRLVLVGTRVKEDKENNNNKEYTDYMMVENNAMMGGGKNGSKIEFEDSNKETIPSSTVTSKKGLEVVLEKDGDLWKLNVGKDENDTPLYLYATAKKSDEESNDMMEMFMSSTGLKVGTEADALAEAEPKEDEEDTDIIVSLKASISFTGNNATIKFEGISDDNDENDKKNNTIMLSSSFDMEEMMGMFGGNNSGGGNSSSSSSFDMGSFDMFMASFNTKKKDDDKPKVENNETKAPKCFMPRIYRFVPDASYNITIGSTEWKTIVSYKDVQVPENVEAYIVTKVTPEETKSVASLKPVKELKGGEPYLLHYTSQAENYTMTLLTPNDPDELEAPKGNILLKSTRTTKGEPGNSTVYVLANKSLGVGFYRWTGGDLGAGRVYLPVDATVAGAHEYCGFIEDETTAIQSIDNTKTDVGPFYDLQGRRVDNPTKGIYIVNGKKIVIK